MFLIQVSGKEGFYNFVHMANTLSAVDWAIGRGANAVEMDMSFNSTTGDLMQIHHGFPCGCTCKCPPPWFQLCGLETDQVCAPLFYDVKGDPCEAETLVPTMFNHIATKREIALIYLDSKIKDMRNETMQKAGNNVVKAVNQYLFGAGYGGKVIIGILKLSALPYLEAVINEASRSVFKNRIYFTIEGEQNKIVDVLKQLHSLPTQNIVYGTGSSSCNPFWPINDTTFQLAAINKVRRVSGMSYSWTVDKTSRMKFQMNFLQGIMTNYPGKLYDLLVENGVELASQSSTIPVATNADVVTSTSEYSCQCEDSKNGCVITSAAPRGMACKCERTLLLKCQGIVVNCHDTNSWHCQTPDISVYSCLQGGGDCNGYNNEACDCSYNSGGCVVTKAPISNSSCNCVLKDALKCVGSITLCKDTKSTFCKRPDTSINTCILGGGNCNGYTNSKCDCASYRSGCYVTKFPPPGSACRCIRSELSCRGNVVLCLDSSSFYCRFPDKSVQSCFQGNGNCEGYTTVSCDCSYQQWGCIVSKPPPPNTTCHCETTGNPECRGKILRCRDPSNYYCVHPDNSKSTCLVGGGNCGGYK